MEMRRCSRAPLGVSPDFKPIRRNAANNCCPTSPAMRSLALLFLSPALSLSPFSLSDVRESFGLETLKDYRTGGTVHVIINNQIGFTTLPRNADSAVYCRSSKSWIQLSVVGISLTILSASSDVAKITQCPVFHVNGDNPEAVIRAMKIAIEYRQRFHRDVVVDLTCYRRHGHNEQVIHSSLDRRESGLSSSLLRQS